MEMRLGGRGLVFGPRLLVRKRPRVKSGQKGRVFGECIGEGRRVAELAPL